MTPSRRMPGLANSLAHFGLQVLKANCPWFVCGLNLKDMSDLLDDIPEHWKLVYWDGSAFDSS
jgi:hypothetical protein